MARRADIPGTERKVNKVGGRGSRLERRVAPGSGVTSIADSASGTPLTGDVTLTGGLNIELAQIAQDIRIDGQIEMFVATTSTDNPALGGGHPTLDDGGVNYRGWIWAGEGGGATVVRRDFGSFDGIILLPMIANDAAIVLSTGVYIIIATALVTFPAQAPTREGRLALDVSSDGVTVLVHDAGKQFLEMGNSSDRVESFQATALVSIDNVGRKITPAFYEDDAAGTRDGTTLSSARTLEFVVIKLKTAI